MRVLHVYSGNLYGGIETMLVTLARHRDLCPEMEPHFALCFEGRLSDELIAACAPMYQLGTVRASRFGSVLRARRKLDELLRQEAFDVVICHAPWSLAIFGPVVRSLRTPLVFWMHGPVDGHHWSERWARRATPDLVLCNSRFTAQSLPKLFPNVRSEVVYCPVAFSDKHYSKEDRLATRSELDTTEDAVVIIQVSRMEALKGHRNHLESLSRLSNTPNWVCWLVGGAQRPSEVTYFAELQSLSTQLGIADRVRFIGERSDVPRLLHAADVYCQPNIYPDAFGIAFVEALDANLPIVTTVLGGVREIVNDSCGFEVQPDDIRGLSEALSQLIHDRDLRERLGRVGKARARDLCDVSRQMRRLRNCLITTCVR